MLDRVVIEDCLCDQVGSLPAYLTPSQDDANGG